MPLAGCQQRSLQLAMLPRCFWPCPTSNSFHACITVEALILWVEIFLTAKSTTKIMKVSTPRNYLLYHTCTYLGMINRRGKTKERFVALGYSSLLKYTPMEENVGIFPQDNEIASLLPLGTN